MAEPSQKKSTNTLDAGHAQLSRWALWLRNFLPSTVRIGYAEALRMSIGIFIGLLVTGVLSRWWGESANSMWMASSLGASAVLLFGMPNSPMAQPWPVLVGTVLSALVGAAVQLVVPDTAVACALAVGLSVLLMVPLRCMHPPGAGFAAFVVLEHINGVTLVVFPILFNVAVVLACAVVYNTLTGKRYPHPQHSNKRSTTASSDNALIAAQDLDAALSRYNQVLDISRADLENLIHIAGRSAFNRNFGSLRCADIMSHPVFAVESGVEQKQAWALMQQEQVKALPVVNAQGQLLGIVGVNDFISKATNPDSSDGIMRRIGRLVIGRGAGATKVDALMDTAVQPIQAQSLLVDLVPLFSKGGCHHLPVVDSDNQLVGIVTQTDLIRALSQAMNLSTDT